MGIDTRKEIRDEPSLYSFSGLFVVLLGIPVYSLWSRGAAGRVDAHERS